MNWTNIALMVQLFLVSSLAYIFGIYYAISVRKKSQLTGIQRKKWSNCRR